MVFSDLRWRKRAGGRRILGQRGREGFHWFGEDAGNPVFLKLRLHHSPIEQDVDFRLGKLTRRQFVVSLATLAAGSLAAPGALAAPPASGGFRAVSVNHVTVKLA